MVLMPKPDPWIMPAPMARTFLRAPPSSTPTTSCDAYTRKRGVLKANCNSTASARCFDATTTAVGCCWTICAANDGPDSTANRIPGKYIAVDISSFVGKYRPLAVEHTRTFFFFFFFFPNDDDSASGLSSSSTRNDLFSSSHPGHFCAGSASTTMSTPPAKASFRSAVAVTLAGTSHSAVRYLGFRRVSLIAFACAASLAYHRTSF
mmetsp:Transcript_15132/g.49235  ORF Transcript_15132/g.49235 Transcript_15132/m.49235 type:complete len:206 (+) Transcript_15132:1140-1757(+)